MRKLIYGSLLSLGLVAASCSSDDDTTSTPVEEKSMLNLNLTGLESLGDNYAYEGWIIVDGNAISTGVFTVDGTGNLSKKDFELNKADLDAATKFVLTIEPANDTDPAPSNTKYLVGDFNGNSASVNTAIVGDFSNSSGQFILASPTDDVVDNDQYGIWFVNPTGENPVASLNLPELEEGWKYEGWVVTEDGKPLTTGTFTNVSATDEAAPFSGPVALPMPNGENGFFPGEDYLVNAPDGVTFPLDVRGKTVVITVEPFPDNDAKPFTLKPLVGTAGEMIGGANLHDLELQNNFPTGTVTR
ncbi:anti-sigma factor [Aureivirga sp. CE67]|uniref:anti-sigma factor n=1 Tax=Aureivirga sp. CE67 TaxID=1788983 RepID=UPI0018CA24A4|nr:anti-sigma factor [Aureivirga sp. CE67]